VVHRSGLFAFALFEFWHGAAAKHFVLQESFDRRLRARSTTVELSAFGLCDCPRDEVFSVARFGGPGRLSCVAGHCGPVHGVPHKSLGDSKGPGTAECNRLKVLHVDGGLDFFGKGLPRLFVDVATCALLKGRYEESQPTLLYFSFCLYRQKKTAAGQGKEHT